jgi:peptide chain release factor subunit 3
LVKFGKLPNLVNFGKISGFGNGASYAMPALRLNIPGLSRVSHVKLWIPALFFLHVLSIICYILSSSNLVNNHKNFLPPIALSNWRGYNPKKDLVWLPISGLMGHNMKDRVDEKLCPWFKGPSLFEALDNIDPMLRDPYAPFRMPIVDKYKDMGTVIMGKSEAGLVKKNDSLIVMPNKAVVKVTSIWRDEKEVNAARPGENLRLRVAGVEEEDISAGFVVSSRFNLVPVVTQFEAQVAILDLLEHKPILAGGYRAVLHIHSIVEECEVIKLVAVIDAKTKEKKKAKFVKSGSICIARIAVDKPICIEAFDMVPQLGRFTLRDEGRTIAIGKVTRVPKKGAKSTAE